MRITLYTHSKKPNSTNTPQGGTSYQCQIYDPCSILQPVIIIAGDDPTEYNYAYIPKWGRYYFVTDWEYREARWFGSLNVDVLASYKSQIGASSQYIARSAAAGNGGIQDTLYPCYASPTYAADFQSNPWTESGGGTYVVGVNGGTTRYYAMSQSQFQSLVSYIFSDDYADEVIGDVFSDVYPELKAQLNPLQYIASVTWYPFTISAGISSSVTVGWVTTPVSGNYIPPNFAHSESLTFAVPSHPQGGPGSYLQMAPYSEFYLYFPPFGTIALPSEVCATNTSLTVNLSVDPISSEGILRVVTGGNIVVSRVSSRVGVAVQLGQITAPGYGLGSVIQGVAGTVGDIANTVGSALSGNIAGAVGGVANTIGNLTGTIGNVAASQIPSINSIGSSTGGYASLIGACALIGKFRPVVAKDPENRGTPLCEIRTVSSLPGYLEVKWPHLEIKGTLDEVNAIYRYMEGGFYYD